MTRPAGDVVSKSGHAQAVARVNGVHTAGSSSQISDCAGACAHYDSEEAVGARAHAPARIIAHCLVGVDPV